MIDADTAPIPTTGRRLRLPPGPVCHLQRAAASTYEIGAFRPWAGYKDYGSDTATDGLVLFQHVLSFGPTEQGGRTGVHCHLAQVHIVIPTSGLALFSYDGVVTEAAPGSVIVQHGGTVHDQFQYSYAPASVEENGKTPLSLEPTPPDAPTRSFGFLELFVPATIAHVEIVPAKAVSEADQRSAWRHPYHAEGAHFAIQRAEDAEAVYRPIRGMPQFEARDGHTWRASGALVASWIVRAAPSPPASAAPLALTAPGETGGLELLFVISGSAKVIRRDGEQILLEAGDCLTSSQGFVGDPFDPSPDLSLLKLFVSSRAQNLRQRTPGEIAALQALGAGIVTSREERGEGDRKPVNFLREP